MQNKNGPKTNERQNLLGDLESIQRLLHEDNADGQTTAPEKIPILLDAVPTVIPVLKEIVETPTANAPAAASTNTNTPTSHTSDAPITSATETRLTLEGEQLIENLLEEYLPMIESRLREQLRLRLNFIIKEQMKKYR